MSNKHGSGIVRLEHRGLRDVLTLTIGFTTILCWWVAIIGIANTLSAGSAVFLVVPVLATIATLF